MSELKDWVGQVQPTSPPRPVARVPMVRAIGHGYAADVGQRDGYVFYHLYPGATGELERAVFERSMEEAFIEVYHHPDEIESAWEEELRSFSVRVLGGAENLYKHVLANKLIAALSEKLEAARYPGAPPTDAPDID